MNTRAAAFKNLAVLATAAAVVALPFIFRRPPPAVRVHQDGELQLDD